MTVPVPFPLDTEVGGISEADGGDPTSALLVARPMTQGAVQFPAFANPLNVDLALGTVIEPGQITSSFTIALIGTTLLAPGLVIRFIFLHDNTANVYVITWPANFKKNFALTNTALGISIVSFECDGVNWVQIAHENALV